MSDSILLANASDLFTNGALDDIMLGIGLGITIVSLVITYMKHFRKDLATYINGRN